MVVAFSELACRLIAPPDSCATLLANTMRWILGAPSDTVMAPPFADLHRFTVSPAISVSGVWAAFSAKPRRLPWQSRTVLWGPARESSCRLALPKSMLVLPLPV